MPGEGHSGCPSPGSFLGGAILDLSLHERALHERHQSPGSSTLPSSLTVTRPSRASAAIASPSSGSLPPRPPAGPLPGAGERSPRSATAGEAARSVARGRADGGERADAAARYAREADRRTEVEQRLGALAVERLACSLLHAPDVRVERQHVAAEREVAHGRGRVGPTPGSSVRSSGQPRSATARAARCRLTARRL